MPRGVLLKIANQKPGTPCGHECDPGAIFCFVRDEGVPLESTVSLLVDGIDSDDKDRSERSRNAVRELCHLFQRTRMQEEELLRQQHIINDLEKLIVFLKDVNESLARDSLTGLLTGQSSRILLERLFENGLMDQMRNSGYLIRFVCLDVDYLKDHNEKGPGGHAKGDLAIQVTGNTVAKLFKRGSDITALDLLHTHPDDEQSINESDETMHLGSRSNAKGDEFVAYTFISPEDSKRVLDTDEAKQRIIEGFKNCHYEYEGVRYDVTVTFAMAELAIPTSYEELITQTKIVDDAMLAFKKTRDKSKTDGIIVAITEDIA